VFYFIEFFSARTAAAVSARVIERIHPASVHNKRNDATGMTCLLCGTAYAELTRNQSEKEDLLMLTLYLQTKTN